MLLDDTVILIPARVDYTFNRAAFLLQMVNASNDVLELIRGMIRMVDMKFDGKRVFISFGISQYLDNKTTAVRDLISSADFQPSIPSN